MLAFMLFAESGSLCGLMISTKWRMCMVNIFVASWFDKGT